MFRLSWKHDFIATWSHALHYFGRDAARGCVQWNDHSATPLGQKGVALLKNQWNPMSWDLSQLRPLGLSESLPAVPGGRVEDSDLTTSRWTKAEMWPSKTQKSNPHNNPFEILSNQDLATQGQRSKNAREAPHSYICTLTKLFWKPFCRMIKCVSSSPPVTLHSEFSTDLAHAVFCKLPQHPRPGCEGYPQNPDCLKWEWRTKKASYNWFLADGCLSCLHAVSTFAFGPHQHSAAKLHCDELLVHTSHLPKHSCKISAQMKQSCEISAKSRRDCWNMVETVKTTGKHLKSSPSVHPSTFTSSVVTPALKDSTFCKWIKKGMRRVMANGIPFVCFLMTFR